MNRELEQALRFVQKPARYTGGELNSIKKDKSSVDVRFAFCFPDTYEVGMSHLGMKILYGELNEMERVACERVFAPWIDMEEQMRARSLPLFALESGDPVAKFDIVGFTLQYELSYSNVLNMLSLAGLPLRTADRDGRHPLIIAGGPCACNPEPLAPFIDLFCLGEGEELTRELVSLYAEFKKKNEPRSAFLRAAASIEGVYVPSLYEESYNEDGTLAALRPRFADVPKTVKKRVVRDLESVYFPEKIIVPFIDIVHDRVMLEVFRGCIRGCRFCQAGFLYRPVREKSPALLNKQAKALCESTGYDEISLSSLSTSDYTGLQELLPEMLDWTKPSGTGISLPSLRIDNFPKELAEELGGPKKTSLTFAPEAGTQRLRDAINKNITEEDILSACRRAFEAGWTSVKLYFMLGLPGETMEDVEGIAQLAQKVVDAYYHLPTHPKGRGVTVSVSVAVFVPKPFTPFQWEPQDCRETVVKKQAHLLQSVKSRKIHVKYHGDRTSFLEAAFARGNRKLADVLEAAYKLGCKFDGWDECFDFEKWMQAFAQCGLDPAWYACRRRSFDELLPWSHLNCGVSEAFLRRENEKAAQCVTTPNCRESCSGCGVNSLEGGCPLC